MGGRQRRPHPAHRAWTVARKRRHGGRAAGRHRRRAPGGRKARTGLMRMRWRAAHSTTRWWSATGWTPTSPAPTPSVAQPDGAIGVSNAPTRSTPPGQRPTSSGRSSRPARRADTLAVPSSRPGGRGRRRRGRACRTGGDPGGDGLSVVRATARPSGTAIEATLAVVQVTTAPVPRCSAGRCYGPDRLA